MEKDRSARLIAIVALVLAVTGVSIGFATLSANLTIEPATVNVDANKDLFKVYFSSNDTSYANGQVTPVKSADVEGFEANNINVDPNSIKLSGIGGTFNTPGQTITYTLGVSNQSKLDGYLNAITFKNPSDSASFVKCSAVTKEMAGNPISEGELATACDKLKVTVTIDDTPYTTSDANITSKKIDANSTKKLEVKITYDSDAIPVTGDFKAEFGTIELVYKTEDNAAAD